MSDPNNPYGQNPGDPYGQNDPYAQNQGNQNPYGQPSYGQQPYGQPTGPVGNHPQAVTVLVLGIVGLVCCSILGPVAWYMGNKTVKEIDAAPGQYGGRDLAKIGMILGIIGTVLLVLWVPFFILGGLGSLAGA